MSELEDIKARAAERREKMNDTFTPCTEAEADLDRAITIAEKLGEACDAYHDEAMVITKERDQARAAAEKWSLAFNNEVDGHAATAEKLLEARAAALALRDAIAVVEEWRPGVEPAQVANLLADTEWLEQHRE